MNERQGVKAPHPIFWAAERWNYQVVRKLLNLDESLVKKRDWNGSHLLHYVEDPELFMEIVKMDPTLLTEKNESEYPIHEIASWADEPFLRWVLEQDKSQLYLKNRREETLLHLIVRSDTSISFVEWILEENPSLISAKDKYGETPLHASFRNIHVNPDMTRFLIERKPELLFEENQDGEFPIDCLLTYSETAFLLWLFERFPELICHKKGLTGGYPIHYIAANGDLVLLEYLLEKTPNDLL